MTIGSHATEAQTEDCPPPLQYGPAYSHKQGRKISLSVVAGSGPCQGAINGQPLQQETGHVLYPASVKVAHTVDSYLKVDGQVKPARRTAHSHSRLGFHRHIRHATTQSMHAVDP